MEKKERESPLANTLIATFDTLISYGIWALVVIGIMIVLYIALIAFVYSRIASPVTDIAAFNFIQRLLGVLVIFLMIYFPLKLVYVFLSRLMDKKLPEEKQKAGDKKADTKNEKSELHKWPILIILQKIIGWALMISFIVLIIWFLNYVFTKKPDLKQGVLPALQESLSGNKKGTQGVINTTTTYNPQSTNPNVVVRQTEKTKRDSLYYDNLEKKWLHDEKMKKMEAEKEVENNKPIQMIPINSFQTPQHPDNGWGGQQNNNTGSSTNMTQLEGFQKPQ